MNNFVFSQDPILYNSTIPQYQQDPQELKKQLDIVMSQYQALQQNQSKSLPQEQQIDYLGELDELTMNLDSEDMELLNNNIEFIQLNSLIQQAIQSEIVKSIKWKINNNPEHINTINKLKSIIKDIKIEKEKEQKRNMSELNDYIQNYSDMTFNEYKKIKSKS